MSLAKQLLCLRIPAAKEFVALVLLNLFLFVHLISVCEALETKVESKKATSTLYSAQQTVKPAQTDKAPSLEKLTFIAVLSARFLSSEPAVSISLDECHSNFFLSDPCSSSSLKGRAPPVA